MRIRFARPRSSCRSIACTLKPTVRFWRPCPIAGEKNEPAYVAVVGEYVAELRDEDPERPARGHRGQLRETLQIARSLIQQPVIQGVS